MKTERWLFIVTTCLTCATSTSHVYPSPHPYLSPNNNSDERTPLYFGVLQSFGGDFDGSGSIAGVRVALDLINRDASLLPGYRLHYTSMDSQVQCYLLACVHKSSLPNWYAV